MKADPVVELPDPVAQITRHTNGSRCGGHSSGPSRTRRAASRDEVYTADQMRAAIAAERERCAKICEENAPYRYPGDDWLEGFCYACDKLAKLIRNPSENPIDILKK